jgi:ABC-type lipoprotein export system ATPase subunit/biotin carboxyl carrier protein
MLRMSHVWRTYPVGDEEIVALQDVNLDIRDGDLMAIVGPSGSGKSTLLQIIGLLDRPTRGVVELDGRDLHDISDAERTRLRLTTLGFVFQRFHLLNDLTAIENVTVPMEALGLPPRERYERAAWLLKAVGLGERLDFKPSRLSGGQRQRVAIARALANGPRIILADEPTGELHTDDKAQVIALFKQLNSEGCAIVMVTHDQEVATVARRRIEIRDGKVTEVGVDPPTLPPAETSPRGGSIAEPAADERSISTPEPPAGAVAGRVLAPPLPKRKRRTWPRRLAIGLLLLAVVAGGVAAYWLGLLGQVGGTPAAPAPSVAEAPAYPTARGEIRPIAQAKIGTLHGGVVNRLAVSVGQNVDEAQEIARINGPDGSAELLVAPWRGTITDIPVHVGDTVAVGAVVASIGDLSRLQVETTDVDEFIVGRVKPGNMVLVTVDALDQRQLRGRIRSVSLEPRPNADGDDAYPTIIDLELPPPELRIGMSVRVAFVQ